MATWPGTLPTAPEGPGYNEQAPNTTVRTNMDTGPAKVRRRFTAGVRIFSFTFILTKAQVATLDTFYVTTLVGGSTTFDGLNHPRTGSAATFRFVSAPQYSYIGPDAYRTTCQMEILP